jgi:3-hydroxyacyl-CoA dehydrogenase
VWSVTVAKKSNGVVKKNSGASLVDLGDGVGCIEFHSKMNSLGADIISLITQTLKPGGPATLSTPSSSPTTPRIFPSAPTSCCCS